MGGRRFEGFVKLNLSTRPEYRPSTPEEDKIWGVDFYWAGLPVDVTNSPEKSHVEWLWSDDRAESMAISVGVRSGNGRHRFRQPTLVILVEPPSEVKAGYVNTCPVELRRGWEKLAARQVTPALLEDASSLYWDWDDVVNGSQ